jgi:hypothetical protein
MDEVLYAEDVVFAEYALDDSVVRNGNALLVHFAVTTLVDELANRLEIWFPARVDIL